MDEATAAGWEWTDEQFSAVDADGNGTLDEEEFTTAVAD
jgi:Ca2+-binding EF-hand superfamily protein